MAPLPTRCDELAGANSPEPGGRGAGGGGYGDHLVEASRRRQGSNSTFLLCNDNN
jgi:hypothetical protein